MVHNKKELAQGWISANNVSSSGLLQTYFYLRKELISQTEHRYTGTHLEENRIRIFQLQGTYNDHWLQIPNHSRADWSLYSRLLRSLSKSFLNWQVWGLKHLSRSLLQCFTTLLVKKCFFMPSLSISWHSFELFLGVLCLWIPGGRAQLFLLSFLHLLSQQWAHWSAILKFKFLPLLHSRAV